jgi:hypothetical protein
MEIIIKKGDLILFTTARPEMAKLAPDGRQYYRFNAKKQATGRWPEGC